MRRRWIFAPLPFAILGSTCSHGSVVVALLFGAGHARGAGEGGHAGAGDTSVDVSLAGDPQPETAANAPPEETKSDDKSEDAVEPPRPQKPAVAQQKPATPQTQHGADDSTNGGKLPGPVRVGSTNAGNGETVEGQRALLPSAARCNDPVEGKWEALKYSTRQSTWVHFTLTVHRDAAGVLSGTILSRTWGGSVFDRDPPPCTFGGFDMTVRMPALGRVDATGRITFGSSRYSIVEVRCFALDSSYAPDNFSGTIDAARQEFQSLNNDGAFDINAPYVFRRTGC